MTPTAPRHRNAAARSGRLAGLVLVAVAALLAASCSSPADDAASRGSAELGPAVSTPDDEVFPEGTTVRLLAHDSFAMSEEVLDQFTARTNIEVEIVLGGDAVVMVNQAVLTAGNPQADVLFGVDDNTLGRAVDAGLFEPYVSPVLGAVAPGVTGDPGGQVTPIDFGDVCVNYDRAWFAERDLAVPTTLDALADPAYADLLVVQDPATSTPGLAFLLATVAEFGAGTGADAPWLAYWQRLRDNGVRVVDSWETAYFTDFSGSSGAGPRPLVVSYGSSPAAEVTEPYPAADEAPTGSIDATCYRQTEFAGVLRGTANPAAAQALIDYMVSAPFQAQVPAQMFVFPVSTDVELTEPFVTFAAPATDPLSVPTAEVDASRDTWIGQWSALFR
jgi:thiamine transport system substrate-binding protein